VSRVARLPAWPLTAAGALAWLIVDPPTPDLPAHLYRAEIGFGIWNNGWYAGHHLPGYSVLVPPLAALTSPQLVAALCAVLATWCFERLARLHWTGAAATAAVLWFALAALSPLVAGQLVFAAGLAPGLGALLAARRGHTALGVLLAAATTLTSPVAAAFLCLALAAWLVAGGGRPPAALLAGAIVPGLALLALFPEGGTQPFSVSSFAWAFVLALVLAAVLPREERALRAGALLYAAGLLAAAVLDTPVGGNAVRFAAVFGGPLAAGALWERRRVALALLALPLLYYQWLAPVRAVLRSAGDPATEARYFAPLVRELDRRAAAEGPLRVEIPFTSSHFEAAQVAPAHPLARGWLRQLDVAENGLFYGDAPLTPARYRAWLDELGVRYVAVPGAALDEAGEDEARLVRAGQVPGVRPVWRGGDWTLFGVAGAPPLATPPIRVTRIDAGEIGLSTPRPATGLVRVRYSRHLTLTRGRGCVSRGPGGFTRVRLERAGSAVLGTQLRLLPARTRCKR
jgi:hypothetical protein